MLNQLGRLIPLPLPDWSKPIIALLVLVAAGFGVRTRIVARRVRRLERHERELTDDLASMQLALVPEIPPRIGDLDISVAYRPADGPAAGGDFYDVFALGDGRIAMLLGDVSGHGRTALAHANHMHHALRAYVEAGLGPRGALKLAGQVLAPSEGELFSTVVIAVYDPDAGTLTYATAGHPPPLTTGTPHEPIVQGYASPALGWGIPAGRRQTTVPFARGARICLFSDGLTEARGSEGMLERQGLAQLLADLGSEASSQTLLERVRGHAEEIRDDMAACLITASGGSSAVPATIEELEVEPKQLERQATRFLNACRVPEADIPALIERARAVAGEQGAALISVEMAPTAPYEAVSTAVSTPANVTSPAPARVSRQGKETDTAVLAFPGSLRQFPSRA